MNEQVGKISRGGVALLVALIALSAGACSSKSSGIAATNPITPAPVSTTVPASAQTPSASPVEGVWETAHLSESDMENAYVAAGGTAKAAHAFWLGNGPGTTYVVITIKLLGGAFSAFSSSNGDPAQEISAATYELVGSNEVRTTDDPRDSQCVIMWRYVRQGNTLALHYVNDNRHCSKPIEVPGPIDPTGPTIFGSFPFTLAG